MADPTVGLATFLTASAASGSAKMPVLASWAAETAALTSSAGDLPDVSTMPAVARAVARSTPRAVSRLDVSADRGSRVTDA